MKNRYRFSIKKEERGHGSKMTLFCALASMGVLAAAIIISFSKRGAGPSYVGAMGLCSMIVSFTGALLGFKELKGTEKGKRNPLIGTLVCGIIFIIWLALILNGV